MTYDMVELDRDLRRREARGRFQWFRWLVFLLLTGFSLYMYLWETGKTTSDLFMHMRIAGEFDFTDMHSITSRLAYPLWHIAVAALFQLGVPLAWAAAVVCALCKGVAFLLVRRYIAAATDGRISETLAVLCALLVSLVTPILVPGLNNMIYRGVGSPTVWHNPTQLAVLVTAMLCVPYTLHCWYAFERELPAKGDRAMLPWRKVVVLALLLMVSLACKPTFLQALIPAAAVFFLAQWIRHPRNSRHFFQIILAFIPAVAYFLLQYLYYTGVVVPYTSGVVFALTLQSAWLAVRNMLLMAAFPLFALVCCYRPGFFRDKNIVLVLLMTVFSILEAMSFQETGVRINHGNFNWASMSTAFMLWVIVMPKFITAVTEFRDDRTRLMRIAGEGTVASTDLNRERKALRLRSALFLAAFMLLVWHLYSAGYYLYYLFSTGSTF